jgi:predicted MFS family arabinose efflux permease
VLALRIRDFRLLWTGELLSSLGSWLLLVAVPYKVFELTGSALATGITFIAESLPALVIGPVAGVAADRWDRRRIMLAVSLGQAGCILPVAFVHRPGQVTIIYAALIAESVLGQLYAPAAQALIPSLVGRNEELTSANALSSASNAVTRLVGALLGGVLLAALGLTAVVLIDVGSYLASAGCLGLLRWRAVRRDAESGRERRAARAAAAELRQGFRHMAASRPLRGLLLAAAMFQLGNGAFTAVLVPYIQLRLHGTAADVGFLIAATGAGFLIGAPLSRGLFHRVRLRILASMALLITAAAYVGWFSTSNLGGALPLAALTGMSAMIFLVTRRTWLQRLTPGRLLGRASSAFAAAEGGAGLIGITLGGILIGLAGLTATVATAGLAIAGGAVLAAILLRAPPPASVPDPPASAAGAQSSRVRSTSRRYAAFATIMKGGRPHWPSEPPRQAATRRAGAARRPVGPPG